MVSRLLLPGGQIRSYGLTQVNGKDSISGRRKYECVIYDTCAAS